MPDTLKVRKDSLVTLALAVANGTTHGDVVQLGTNGLKGYANTDQATAANAPLGKNAPGLVNGQASVTLLGVSLVASLQVSAAINAYDKVYQAADKSYTPVSTGATFIGFALGAQAAAGKVLVALTNA